MAWFRSNLHVNFPLPRSRFSCRLSVPPAAPDQSVPRTYEYLILAWLASGEGATVRIIGYALRRFRFQADRSSFAGWPQIARRIKSLRCLLMIVWLTFSVVLERLWLICQLSPLLLPFLVAELYFWSSVFRSGDDIRVFDGSSSDQGERKFQSVNFTSACEMDLSLKF